MQWLRWTLATWAQTQMDQLTRRVLIKSEMASMKSIRSSRERAKDPRGRTARMISI